MKDTVLVRVEVEVAVPSHIRPDTVDTVIYRAIRESDVFARMERIDNWELVQTTESGPFEDSRAGI